MELKQDQKLAIQCSATKKWTEDLNGGKVRLLHILKLSKYEIHQRTLRFQLMNFLELMTLDLICFWLPKI